MAVNLNVHNVIKAILIAILIAIGAYSIGALIFLGWGQVQLNLEAHKDKQALSKIVIVNGQPTAAKGNIVSDSLTSGVDNVTASATFLIDETLAQEDSSVQRNLNKAGFVADGKPITDTIRSDIHYVLQKYIRGKETIVIRYTLNKPYPCPQDKECYYYPNKVSSDQLFDVSLLAYEKVKRLDVGYKQAPLSSLREPFGY